MGEGNDRREEHPPQPEVTHEPSAATTTAPTLAGALSVVSSAQALPSGSPRPDTVILHSRDDDVVPFADSEELARSSGATLIEVGTAISSPQESQVSPARIRHTCHHRTQVQSWLRLAGHEPIPTIYGPSGDVKWDEADPTYSLETAKRGG